MVFLSVRQLITVRPWTFIESFRFLPRFAHQEGARPPRFNGCQSQNPRYFNDYFVTHLPSSSLHPDPRTLTASYHKLPRLASTPQIGTGQSSISVQTPEGIPRETTVVRIPLRRAKHHFGASISRGSRYANEDAYQAGVIRIPTFAKRTPRSVTLRHSFGALPRPPEDHGANDASDDPQVFYFGVFDGHGGSKCSEFLRDRLHEYIEDAVAKFEVQSSLRKQTSHREYKGSVTHFGRKGDPFRVSSAGLPVSQKGNRQKIGELETRLVEDWKNLVGGYFKRFQPAQFSYYGDSSRWSCHSGSSLQSGAMALINDSVCIEEVVEYAFLHADIDFITAQAIKRDDDPVQADQPLNGNDIFECPSQLRSMRIGGPKRFLGGSTCSVAMISAPTSTPFWHPTAASSLAVSHVGDTRVILCHTATGAAIPLTCDHHPSSPVEANRLRRYAATFVTDSFGEERMSGLANTRAFGDINSKRIGVSAEPETRRVEMGPAEYSFLILVSDGVSGVLSDQEVVDIVKEALTPEQAANEVVSFATDVSTDADNATCLVVRLGGWERRLEGGLGSMGTKESRDWRRQEATNPRRART